MHISMCVCVCAHVARECIKRVEGNHAMVNDFIAKLMENPLARSAVLPGFFLEDATLKLLGRSMTAWAELQAIFGR